MEPCEECGATEGVRAFGTDQTPLCPVCYARAERHYEGVVRSLEITRRAREVADQLWRDAFGRPPR